MNGVWESVFKGLAISMLVPVEIWPGAMQFAQAPKAILESAKFELESSATMPQLSTTKLARKSAMTSQLLSGHLHSSRAASLDGLGLI